MRARVSIRGSHSNRFVVRDASPRKIQPYASLMIDHPDGSTTRYELSYGTLDNGETVSVYLRETRPGEFGEDVYTTKVKKGGAK